MGSKPVYCLLIIQDHTNSVACVNVVLPLYKYACMFYVKELPIPIIILRDLGMS